MGESCRVLFASAHLVPQQRSPGTDSVSFEQDGLAGSPDSYATSIMKISGKLFQSVWYDHSNIINSMCEQPRSFVCDVEIGRFCDAGD